MIECGNCGGNLKFDIPSQLLKCEHCGSTADPNSIVEREDAEKQSFETTEYICPQCGGKIYANDTSAAEFCVYCGGSTILTGQISNEKRPDFLLPFTKSKEDCKKAYKRLMRRSLFAPSELKNPDNLDKFRGIYIPYWSYHISQNEEITLKGVTTRRSGNTEITNHYDLTCQLDGDYSGLSHDASSVFNDEITECLAPYNVKERIDFNPAYLSGFYADIADVTSKTYKKWAMELVNDYTFSIVNKDNSFRKYKITKPKTNAALGKVLKSKQEEADSTMYPVWFLTYRKGERLLYATVNGQTGKVVADIPVDYRKYICGSVLLAIPIFILLNILFTFRPSVTLIFATLVTLMSGISFSRLKKKISDRENHVNDKGYKQGKSLKLINAVARQKRKEEAKKQKVAEQKEELKSVEQSEEKLNKTELKKGSEKKCKTEQITEGTKENAKKKLITTLSVIVICIVSLMVIFTICFFPGLLPVTVATIAAAVNLLLLYNRWESKKASMPLILLSIAPAIAAVILFVRPVADLWYYIGTIISFGVVLYSNLEIIKKYNLLSTRSIPSLHDRGGQDND